MSDLIVDIAERKLMSYSDFSLEDVERELGVSPQEADLFPALRAIDVPQWLPGWLTRGTRLALISEKARSEFIVVPILLAARELTGDRFAIYSGQRLDVEPERGLAGDCDFILAVGPALPPLHAPVMTVVEAKKNDIEVGLGQCIAQLVAARLFNQRSGQSESPVYGCVTTGETWQFLRLEGQTALLNRDRYYLDNIGKVLSVFVAIWRQAECETTASRPRNGAELVAYWEAGGLIGTRPDIADAAKHARALRQQAEQRGRP